MNKAELRKKLKGTRSGVDHDTWMKWSSDIQRNCISLVEDLGANSVFIYLESQLNREVATSAIVQYLTEASISMYVPRIKTSGIMNAVLIDSGSHLELNKWGIPEPVVSGSTRPMNLDVAIVPLLGCDTYGNRLGYGKGYYDRFLSKYPGTLTIGLCPELAIVDSVPAEEHDVALNYVVTESRIIRTLP